MSGNDVVSGYLDVKISSRSRRGLTPWKAWRKQWCEIRRLDNIDNGVELKLKSSPDGSVLNCVVLPRSSTICRTESRTKQYAFGVFTLGKYQKPILFLSGSSESDSQDWISSIRRMLCIASYLPVGESNFRVSLIDTAHSRSAGLFGLYGVLSINSQEIVISDPCTGEPKISWQWYQFHQFHLQAPVQPKDDKMVVVMHTSGEFPAGPGQLYLYCKQGVRLLNHLVGRGKRPKVGPGGGLMSSKRLSRSEGDLCGSHVCPPDSPMCFRSQTGSDDSGVRVSIASDDSGYVLKAKTASSLASIGMALLTKTPGGSETEDSVQDLTKIDEQYLKSSLPRRESGVSLASGIYEEIPDDHVTKVTKKKESHIYENPLDMMLDGEIGKQFKPPPLPPRRGEMSPDCDEDKTAYQMDATDPLLFASPTSFKHRCNTLPAKDLARMSQIFTAESDYVPMSPGRLADKPRKPSITESLYMPMSPVINLKNRIVESYYMSMTGSKKN
ncbi:uncharacterized protein LOC109597311 [Aethina tumida]|uniref:uncharacterized protein LOC109597311 n=1 Tax=Aethina tumida TaxID=116153 RepID=UPI002147B63E|nr:uncharacterized protein LOC109597311 [Aethina tumida]